MLNSFHRSQITWLMYLLLAFFGYLLNILGPITPFLMDEFGLSYTLSSMHFTAFASGLILIGLGGHLIVNRIGRWKAIWISATGMSLGSLLFILGPTPTVTILACFLMGTTGSLIPVLVSSILSDQYGALRTVALSEANFFASTTAAIAPLLVGWFTGRSGLSFSGWRMALVVVLVIPLLLRLMTGASTIPGDAIPQKDSDLGGRSTPSPLPARFWIFWTAIVLAVSIEFCMIFWSADYLEKILGFNKPNAALLVSLFLGGMILGRLAGSRFIRRISEKHGILASLVVASFGFLLFWISTQPLISVTGLFLTGLGIANLYPFILSLALESAGPRAVQASARASLASGAAIMGLPLILGRLADSFGIRPAYGVITFLLAGLFLIISAVKEAKTEV